MIRTKRPIESEVPSDSNPKRRVTPMPVPKRPLRITNLDNGETIHQTCVSIHGECQIFEYATETNFVSLSATDCLNRTQSVRHWPIHNGQWKVLIMLSPGANNIELKLHHCHEIQGTLRISLNYVPLLQLPPLHLAILVAKDSPLLIDCPPSKYGSISTAHSSLNAAVAKFRMAAYMWQALTAEDMREKGLGRRAFRLDEEWTSNTTTRRVHHQGISSGFTGSVAKVHIVRSDKTVAELRNAQVAQQNPRGRDRNALHRYFEVALLNSGIPAFESQARPVVAGMLLDAHYSVEKSMILGHAALGCHKAGGLSLGIFGSHLTYSWPRFLEEVPSSLTDSTLTGETVGNDNGECGTMREACSVGQGAFLHEVGHAFGAGHTSGIMARGYSKSWAMNFIEHECNNGMKNDARWDLRDVLKFKLLPHFALPGDEFPTTKELSQAVVSCKAGLAQVTVQNGNDPREYLRDVSGNCPTFLINTTIGDFDRGKPLTVTALGMNGNKRVIKDAWSLLKEKPYISIPGSRLVLRKQSVRSRDIESRDADDFVQWAMLLRHRGADGQLHPATSIDLRVGCTMDGAVVYYADGTRENCGPAGKRHFGGHASESHDIPDGETISKVKVCNLDSGWGSLAGIRMSLSNGDAWGYLNNNDDQYEEDEEGGDPEEDQENDEAVVTLQPGDEEVIVGFFGRSDAQSSGFTYEFGILTAPMGVELPVAVYDMPELRNPWTEHSP